MAKTVKIKILLRNDTAANWTKNNPVLGKGEIGVEIDTRKFKFGDGTTAWNALAYGAGADIPLADASTNGLLSSGDFTKLSNIAAGAQVNVIETVKVNNTALTPDANKAVNIAVPTKTSDITNDSGFITSADVPEGAAASTTVPKMNGTAAVGTETAFARGDHVHPTDTTRASATDLANLTTTVGNKVDKVTGKGLSTEDYTTADKDKLAGIAAGAQANVQSDWNATTGDAAILNKPTTLAGYGISDAMTATQITTAINEAVASAFTYKGTKAAVSDLPLSGNKVGDIWHVTADGGEYVWNGTDWEALGSTIDLSGYLQSVTVAGVTLTPTSSTITIDQLKTALGLAAAAYKNVDTSITTASTSANLPTSAAVASFVEGKNYATTTVTGGLDTRISTLEGVGATKVEASATNGNIKINGVETTVYTLQLPSTTLDSSDTLILDCGNSATNYS